MHLVAVMLWSTKTHQTFDIIYYRVYLIIGEIWGGKSAYPNNAILKCLVSFLVAKKIPLHTCLSCLLVTWNGLSVSIKIIYLNLAPHAKLLQNTFDVWVITFYMCNIV